MTKYEPLNFCLLAGDNRWASFVLNAHTRSQLEAMIELPDNVQIVFIPKDSLTNSNTINYVNRVEELTGREVAYVPHTSNNTTKRLEIAKKSFLGE